MTCAEFDARLDDLLDGGLEAADREAMEAHLATCPACTALYTDLAALQARARLAPREVAPAAAVWHAVSEVTRREPRVLRRPRWRPWHLAAAAVLLVALSSLGTALVLRERDSRLAAHDVQPTTLNPRLAVLEADYQRATAELVRALDAEAALSPSVREALGRHLAVVDAAIAEARASVLERPADLDAGGMLLAAYRQKLDLLERATRLRSES